MSVCRTWKTCALLGLIGVLTATHPARGSDGVNPAGNRVTENPRDAPAPAIHVDLELAWRLGTTTAGEDGLLADVDDVALDTEGNFYLLDIGQRTVIVVAPDGRVRQRIGRPGEGPGDVSQPTRLCMFGTDRLVISMQSPPRIGVFTLTGMDLPDIVLPEIGQLPIAPRKVRSTADRLILSYHAMDRIDRRWTNREQIVCITEDGFGVRDLWQRTYPLARNSHEAFAEDERIRPVWTVRGDGTLCVSSRPDAYEIDVIDMAGNIQETITRDYKRVPFTDHQVELLEQHYRRVFPNSFEMERLVTVRRDITKVFPGPESELWVNPSDGILFPEKRWARLVNVFDADGHYVRDMLFELDSVAGGSWFLLPNYFLVVEETDDDVLALCYRFDVSR